MKLRFTPRALQDLSEIADYIRERNPAAAQRVRAAIHNSVQKLLLFPRMGRQQTTEGVRRLVTSRYPYLVYYTVNDERREVVILSVRHPAQEREHDDA